VTAPDRLRLRAGRVALESRLGLRPPPSVLVGGRPVVGQDLLAGRLRAGGREVTLEPGVPGPWGIVADDPAAMDALHRFGWLDDLGALGGAEARALARRWTEVWEARFGTRRRELAWRPDIAGLRLLALMRNAPLLLDARPVAEAEALVALMIAHLGDLAGRAERAEPGLPRLSALAALVIGSLCLPGQAGHTIRAQAALGRHCAEVIEVDGGLPDRRPDALAEALVLLVAVRAALIEAGQAPDPAHEGAVGRMAGAVRTLRHAGGEMARFHGGGSGDAGAIDLALAALDLRPRPPAGMAAGFARLAAGRTVVIADVTTPPPGGTASMLAFELSSGRRPVIVSRGAFGGAGPHWGHAGRAPEAHAALCLDGVAPAPGAIVEGRAEPAEAAAGGLALVYSHDGYAGSHGLTHVRRLELSRDGRALSGSDMLLCVDGAQRQRFGARVAAAQDGEGLRVTVRFPLHPDAVPQLDPAARCIHIALPSGEVWRLSCHEGAAPGLEPAVFLDDADAGRVRPSWHVVLICDVTAPGHRIGWTLAKSDATPVAVRDPGPEGPADPAPARPDVPPDDTPIDLTGA